MKKIWKIAIKTLLEYWREPQLFGWVITFPILMIAIYYYGFGQAKQGFNTIMNILVINQDHAITTQPESVGTGLVNQIRHLEWEGQPVFNVISMEDQKAAERYLREGKADLLIILPEQLSQTLLTMQQKDGPLTPPEIVFKGNPASFNYVFAQSFLDGLVRQFIRAQVGQPSPSTANYQFIPGTGTLSDFDFGVPGVIVFGILFVIITTSTTLVREDVHHTLQRLRLTQANAAHLLIGVTLAQMVLAAVQIPLAFGAAVAMGFGQGSLVSRMSSLLIAICIGLLFNFSVVGIGFIVAAISHDESEATNLGTLFLVPLAFLSGAMFPMPQNSLFEIGSLHIKFYDFLPSTHASEALRRLLALGDNVTTMGYPLGMLAFLSLVYLWAGIWLFQKLRLENR